MKNGIVAGAHRSTDLLRKHVDNDVDIRITFQKAKMRT
jgi:hypothetical protein